MPVVWSANWLSRNSADWCEKQRIQLLDCTVLRKWSITTYSDQYASCRQCESSQSVHISRVRIERTSVITPVFDTRTFHSPSTFMSVLRVHITRVVWVLYSESTLSWNIELCSTNAYYYTKWRAFTFHSAAWPPCGMNSTIMWNGAKWCFLSALFANWASVNLNRTHWCAPHPTYIALSHIMHCVGCVGFPEILCSHVEESSAVPRLHEGDHRASQRRTQPGEDAGRRGHLGDHQRQWLCVLFFDWLFSSLQHMFN